MSSYDTFDDSNDFESPPISPDLSPLERDLEEAGADLPTLMTSVRSLEKLEPVLLVNMYRNPNRFALAPVAKLALGYILEGRRGEFQNVESIDAKATQEFVAVDPRSVDETQQFRPLVPSPGIDETQESKVITTQELNFIENARTIKLDFASKFTSETDRLRYLNERFPMSHSNFLDEDRNEPLAEATA